MPILPLFRDRLHAGKLLAEQLTDLSPTSLIILALPRGGVPVAYPVARRLRAPLDVLISRKIGSPRNPELGIGAISEDHCLFLDHSLINTLGISSSQLSILIRQQQQELSRRISLYRHDRPLPALKNKTVIIVDDGLATGATARAAIQAVRAQNPASIILAVPVSDTSNARLIESAVDRLICLHPESDLGAISSYYQLFDQVSDQQVINLLQQARKPLRSPSLKSSK